MSALALAGALTGVARSEPIRTLVYRYSLAQQGFGQLDFGPFSLFSNSMSGGQGRVDVSIEQATVDEGLVVDATETRDGSPRSEQAVRCAVYANPSRVFCDRDVPHTSEVEAVLMYTGRRFYDEARLDGKRHWRTEVALDGGGTQRVDYTVERSEGDLITVNVDLRQESKQAPLVTSGFVEYDTVLEVPRRAHLSTSLTGGNFGSSLLDYTLVSDSFAKKAAPTTSP